MKKLMIMMAVLLIAGGISAHGYGGYHGGYGGYHGGYYGGGYAHERVVVRAPYYDPYVAIAPVPYYGHSLRPVYRGYGGYYRGCR